MKFGGGFAYLSNATLKKVFKYFSSSEIYVLQIMGENLPGTEFKNFLIKLIDEKARISKDLKKFAKVEDNIEIV